MTNQSPDRRWTIAETAALLRRVDEAATQRHYFRYECEEYRLWLFEAVPWDGELVAVKQVVVDPSGTVSRYSWQRMQDEHGFLTDQPLYPQEEGLARISAEEFRRHWTT